MNTQQTHRPSVPGARKREGAKNLPVITSVGTWNVRTMNKEGSLEQLLSEIAKFKIQVLGVSETRWTIETPEAFEQDNYVILQSCRKDNISRQGVALIIEKVYATCMTSYECISERLISASFDTSEGP